MFARRGLFFTTLAIAAIGLYSVSNGAEATLPPVTGQIFALAALIVAMAAIGVAIFALNRMTAMRDEFRRFSHSVEITLNDLASRSTRDSASIGELNRMVADEIRSMATRKNASEQANPSAPVSEPRRPRPAPIVPRELPAVSEADADIGEALAAAVRDDELVVSLAPIISVSRSTAAGFEVHAHVSDEDGLHVHDVRRLANPVSGLNQAAFEQGLLKNAIEAGRRQLGSDSEKMPFHIAISDALLGNEGEMQNLAQLASQHRALAKSVVLSMMPPVLERKGKVRDNLDKLTAEGFRIALEDWAGSAEDAATAASRGVIYAKVSVDRLFDRESKRASDPTGAELVVALQEAGIQVIATGVERDEDAVGLIDLGIDLMEGDRFSGPKVLKAPAKRRAAMAET